MQSSKIGEEPTSYVTVPPTIGKPHLRPCFQSSGGPCHAWDQRAAARADALELDEAEPVHRWALIVIDNSQRQCILDF